MYRPEKAIKRLRNLHKYLGEVLEYLDELETRQSVDPWEYQEMHARCVELEKENQALVEQNRRLIKESLGIGETPNDKVAEEEDAPKTFEIWSEGWRANGGSGTATFHGTSTGYTFKEACDNLALRRKDFAQFYDPERMTYWGCKLFDNERDARATFG